MTGTVYKTSGNYKEICDKLDFQWFYTASKSEEENLDAIEKDLPRTFFLGTKVQFNHFYHLWRTEGKKYSYAQGDMTAANIAFLLPDKEFEEPTKIFDEEFNCRFLELFTDMVNRFKVLNRVDRYAYINNDNLACGISIAYTDEDKYGDDNFWIACVFINTTAILTERQVTVYSNKKITYFDNDVTINTNQINTDLITTCKSDSLARCLDSLIKSNGRINKKAFPIHVSSKIECYKSNECVNRSDSNNPLKEIAIRFLTPQLFSGDREQQLDEFCQFYQTLTESEGENLYQVVLDYQWEVNPDKTEGTYFKPRHALKHCLSPEQFMYYFTEFKSFLIQIEQMPNRNKKNIDFLQRLTTIEDEDDPKNEVISLTS